MQTTYLKTGKFFSSLILILALASTVACQQAKKEGTESKVVAEKPKVSIQEAAFFGNKDAIKQHVAAKSDLNEKDDYGSTPLHIAATFGKTDAAILLITHDLAVVAETCDRVIVMYGGEIQEIATIEELFKNPLHPYTKALMNSIPHMERKTKRLKALKGMVPSILEMGDGCKFCSRFEPEECPCMGTKENQELFEAKKNHFVRCKKEMINV